MKSPWLNGATHVLFEPLELLARLAVPLALLMIFILLYLNFNATAPAALIFLNVPLAATGGILALLVRALPFSISAGVGFIALFGVAVLNGVVLLTYISQLREQWLSVDQTVRQGANTRLRPVLMTALVASLGFVPMALSTGRSRGSTSAGDCRYWRPHHFNGANTFCVTDGLPLDHPRRTGVVKAMTTHEHAERATSFHDLLIRGAFRV